MKREHDGRETDPGASYRHRGILHGCRHVPMHEDTKLIHQDVTEFDHRQDV